MDHGMSNDGRQARMRVTDAQVAVLQALIGGEHAAYREAWAALDRDAASTAYATLVASACFEAVDRLFTADSTIGDVVLYVGDVLARSDMTGEALDSEAAERIIRFNLGDKRVDIGDIDQKTRFVTETLLTVAIIEDLALTTDQLDEFLMTAQRFADRWLERVGAPGSTPKDRAE